MGRLHEQAGRASHSGERRHHARAQHEPLPASGAPVRPDPDVRDQSVRWDLRRRRHLHPQHQHRTRPVPATSRDDPLARQQSPVSEQRPDRRTAKLELWASVVGLPAAQLGRHRVESPLVRLAGTARAPAARTGQPKGCRAGHHDWLRPCHHAVWQGGRRPEQLAGQMGHVQARCPCERHRPHRRRALQEPSATPSLPRAAATVRVDERGHQRGWQLRHAREANAGHGREGVGAPHGDQGAALQGRARQGEGEDAPRRAEDTRAFDLLRVTSASLASR